ncbi:RNA polymerase sigma factor [Marinilabilia salmonicolor]|uniref:RNA polymerase sigma factor n=1 Tax=Marinilabilia salmonicolor TaxID=989 RepID=UPI00029B3960|nr:RNA polymerase sigma-70 factor [Marinilabilia salmonicolor]
MTQEQIFIKQLKQGSIQAFNELFYLYSSRLYGFGYKYLKSDTDAEELVQDVFLKIWKNREKINEEENFRAYLFTIAFNQIRDYFKYKSVYLDVEEFQYFEYQDNTTETSLTFRSVLDQITQLLQRLPEKKQRIFHLSRFEGKSSKEIAEIVGVTSKTVDNQISEVIGFLKLHLKKSGFLSWLFFYLFLL